MSEPEPTSTEADLKALKALQADASELEHIETLLNRFNVFETIGFVDQELMHSRILAFLLSPNQNHGLGDRFLKRFLGGA
jgi:PD-(D/E)XK nuclease superfamily protein